MSKERLEVIKHFVDLIKYIPRDSRGMGEMDVVNVQEDMKWLIEQAERVQELENKCEYLSDTNEMLLDLNGVLPDQPELYIKLKKEIKRLEDFIETIQNVHFVELQRERAENRRYRVALKNIYELAEYDEYDNTLEQIVSEIEKALEGEE